MKPTEPVPQPPIIGYWYIGQVYCTRCAPDDASIRPQIWEKIRADFEPLRALVCCRCNRTIALGHKEVNQ